MNWYSTVCIHTGKFPHPLKQGSSRQASFWGCSLGYTSPWTVPGYCPVRVKTYQGPCWQWNNMNYRVILGECPGSAGWPLQTQLQVLSAACTPAWAGSVACRDLLWMQQRHSTVYTASLLSLGTALSPRTCVASVSGGSWSGGGLEICLLPYLRGADTVGICGSKYFSEAPTERNRFCIKHFPAYLQWQANSG